MAMANVINFFKGITVKSVYDHYTKNDGKFIINGKGLNLKIAGVIAKASNNYLLYHIQKMSNEAKSPSDECEPMDFNEKCSLKCNNKYFIIGMCIIDNGDIQFKVHSVDESSINRIYCFQRPQINKVEFGSSPQSHVTAYLTSGSSIYAMYIHLILDVPIRQLRGDIAISIEKQEGCKEDKVGTLIVLEPANCVNNCFSSGNYSCFIEKSSADYSFFRNADIKMLYDDEMFGKI